MKYLTLISILLLISCAHNKDVTLDVIDPSLEFITKGGNTTQNDWWQNFENRELVELVELGLRDNLSLKANELRLKSSVIESKIASSNLYPDLNLSSSMSSSFDEFGDITNASLGLSSSWEIDLWGRLDATANRAFWNQQEQLALYKSRANVVAGNITNAWLGYVSELEKKLILAEQVKRTKDALSVISRRFEMGKISVTNIWQQQKLLKSIEVQQAKNDADLYLFQQTIALWLGVPTEQITIAHAANLPKLPSLPKIGIPAEHLKHRPDIEQAYAKIKAANENLGVAIANRYPRVSLRANYSTSQSATAEIFDNWAGNLVASLALPLIDSGQRKSVVEQRKLQLQALVLDYKQTWLNAIVAVNKVLTNEAQLLQTTENLEQQLSLAKKTEKLTTLKFLNGKTNYLNLLKAQESILSLERQKIDADKRVMLNRVLLYRELSYGNFSTLGNSNKREVVRSTTHEKKHKYKGNQS